MVKNSIQLKSGSRTKKSKQTKNSINDRNCMWIVDCFRHFCFGCCFPLSVFHVFYKKYIELWRALKLNALKTKCWSKLTENIRATRYRHRTNRRERERQRENIGFLSICILGSELWTGIVFHSPVKMHHRKKHLNNTNNRNKYRARKMIRNCDSSHNVPVILKHVC